MAHLADSRDAVATLHCVAVTELCHAILIGIIYLIHLDKVHWLNINMIININSGYGDYLLQEGNK